MIQPTTISEALLSRWMKDTVRVALRGVADGENPFAASVYRPDGSRLALASNQVNSTHNPSAHAEICAIEHACRATGEPELRGCWLVSTAEPCPMCLSAAVNAGIRNIAFGAGQAVVAEAGYGSFGISGRQLAKQMSADIQLRGPILGNDCVSLLLRHRNPMRPLTAGPH
ncbi:nucleoside deaminase [Stieleria sp. TO1_6]|uniref:nucleoside deaminase n=1 Tax=Stieleria tagensis TaxID=2956795 RepID=UPI00209A92E2|nr:nucleoside deaminase [Stieleria tagensis]MCO8121672.1 nucleoside deaminase [Stieleria tagensis]